MDFAQLEAKSYILSLTAPRAVRACVSKRCAAKNILTALGGKHRNEGSLRTGDFPISHRVENCSVHELPGKQPSDSLPVGSLEGASALHQVGCHDRAS